MHKQISGILFLIAFVACFNSGNAIKCYSCNSSTTDPCEQGLSSVGVKECPAGQVCGTYQYDVFLGDKKAGTGTTRGCETEHNYCGVVANFINSVIKPASLKEKKCYTCNTDLCNSSPKMASVLTLIVTLVALKFIF